jgi:hypothetical protein
VNKVFGFGENVEGFSIPVLNEREIRAAAGLLFLATFLSLIVIMFRENFLVIKYVSTFFLIDFLIRVLVNPRYSPTLILGRWIVRNQVPEYVGAPAKKVGWTIGVGLGTIMFIHMVLLNAYSPITGITCLICLVFLFFESAFGICLGCKFYSLVYKEQARYCPGEVCEVKSRHEIQKVSSTQLLVLCTFIACIVLSAFILNETYSQHPRDIFGINKPVEQGSKVP